MLKTQQYIKLKFSTESPCVYDFTGFEQLIFELDKKICFHNGKSVFITDLDSSIIFV